MSLYKLNQKNILKKSNNGELCSISIKLSLHHVKKNNIKHFNNWKYTYNIIIN